MRRARIGRGFLLCAALALAGCDTVESLSFCEAALGPKGQANKCPETLAFQCQAALDNPEVMFHWVLVLEDGPAAAGDAGRYADDVLIERRQCVVDRLTGNGVTDIDDSWGTLDRLSMDATGAQMQSVLAQGIVTSSAVWCSDASFCNCAELTVAQCDGHVFCYTLTGVHYDLVQGCHDPESSVGCSNATCCGLEDIPAYDLDGACWLMSDARLPDSGGWEHADELDPQEECTLEKLENLPACP